MRQDTRGRDETRHYSLNPWFAIRRSGVRSPCGPPTYEDRQNAGRGRGGRTGAYLALLLFLLASPVMAAGINPDKGEVGVCTPIPACSGTNRTGCSSWSHMDAEGRLQAEIHLPGQPWRDVATAKTETFCVDGFPGNVTVTSVRTFIATDRANRAELGLHVVLNDYQLVTRSVHKEVEGIYDAWVQQPATYANPTAATLAIYAFGWPTMRDPQDPTRMLPVNIEFGVIVEMTYTGPR